MKERRKQRGEGGSDCGRKWKGMKIKEKRMNRKSGVRERVKDGGVKETE